MSIDTAMELLQSSATEIEEESEVMYQMLDFNVPAIEIGDLIVYCVTKEETKRFQT